MTSSASPVLTLNNGVTMPQLGFGTWPLKDEEAQRAVTTALADGYRLIDTAAAYGNEDAVGRGIRDSGLDRQEVFVTTKLQGAHHGYDNALRAVDTSLAALGVDYVDLFLIHWPVPARDLCVPTWQAFAKMLADGRARAIGVSNFKPAHLDRIIDETGTVPAVNQIQLSPLTAQTELRDHHRRLGIVTQSWSPLGKGTDLLDHPVITGLSSKYARTPGQIVLRWHMDLGLSAVPKSGDPERIRRNIDVFDFALTPAEVDSITALDTGVHQPADSDVIQPGLNGPGTPPPA
ncbi:aldo/keto reductase [Streptomyces sp. NPDC046909]|uniref:aldo/keto reductase n=1 Tax=Streptomyces sp. NPDC046909 TaxID=3155617 RepID=UPI0033C462E8